MDKMVRFVVIPGADFDRMSAILEKHPEAQAELRAAGLNMTEFTSPTVEEYVNSDGAVVATRQKTEIGVPLDALHPSKK